jgi:homopolymeric O-antigen transport system ATP-binding protein
MSYRMNPAIVVKSVSKQFRRYHMHRPVTLQEALQRGLKRVRPSEHFWSLRDVNFEVSAGRTVGVIGPNGAGKSTLLRLVGGVGRADHGTIQVNGRVGALLDLGAGFHPELTGRENIFVSGVISGLSRREVRSQFDSIVDFSELDEFIEYPLHTYSSGMQLRLAFAIAVHVQPEILLIDEVLAVGDLLFQKKCMERISQFRASGCTILLVSHQLDTVQELCDETIFLRGGQLITQGKTSDVIKRYVSGDDEPIPQFSAEARTCISVP